MRIRHRLTLETPVILDSGLEVPEGEKDFMESILNEFQTLGRLAKAGGTIVHLTAFRLIAGDHPGQFPPDWPPDRPILSVNWRACLSLESAMRFALDEAGDDYAGHLSDSLSREYFEDVPECEIERLFEEFAERHEKLIEEGRSATKS